MQPSNGLEAFIHRYFDEFRILTSGTREERLAAEHGDRVSDWFTTALRTPEGAEDAWPIIVALVERAPGHEAVAFVAAGPLEDLIRDHGPRFIDRLEAQVRTSARFRDAVSGVWGWEHMPPELPERLLPLLGSPTSSPEGARPMPAGKRALARGGVRASPVADTSAGSRYYKLREQEGDKAIAWWFVKVVETDEGNVFDAYVGLDRHGRVVERSSGYGVFEGKAGDFQADSGASVVDEEEFAAAWRAPRAPLSRRRRLLQWLAGVNDERDPTA